MSQKLEQDLENLRASAAVLVLLRGEDLKMAEVLLIQRSNTVKTHQNQVAFPGGACEEHDQNDPTKTALRECREETGIPEAHVKIMRMMPPLPTLTSRYLVFPVLGILNQEATLVPDPNEVSYLEWVSISELFKTREIENGYPVFIWQGNDGQTRKVWGLTAIIFDLILKPYDTFWE